MKRTEARQEKRTGSCHVRDLAKSRSNNNWKMQKKKLSQAQKKTIIDDARNHKQSTAEQIEMHELARHKETKMHEGCLNHRN